MHVEVDNGDKNVQLAIFYICEGGSSTVAAFILISQVFLEKILFDIHFFFVLVQSNETEIEE